MEKISNITLSAECEDSFYIRPARMFYVQDGKKKSWDLMRVHDSFRPAVYYTSVKDEDCEGTIDIKKYPISSGITIELCAGIVDKDKSLHETVKEEVYEECGYDVPLSSIHRVTSYRLGVGVTGSKQTLFYAEVTDAMKISTGGGNANEGEYIEVVELTLAQAQSLIYDESVPKPTSLLTALLWFFDKQKPAKLMQKL